MLENETGECRVCRTPTTQRCSGCKLVYYCGNDHQKSDWKIHKDLCRGYEVCQSAELGKYLKATRDLQVGAIIFSELPLVFGPRPHKIEEGSPVPCVGCCHTLLPKSWYPCPECGWPSCSQTCEGLTDNSRHGLECRILKLRKPSSASFYDFFRFDILIILRTLFLQKTNTSKWEKLLKLESHLTRRCPGSEIHGIVSEKANFLLEHYLTPLKTQILDFKLEYSCDLIHKLYGIFDVNATELTDDIQAEVLYSTGSLLEHNCTPNTSQSINSTTSQITFRASTPIKKSTHITSIYTHILWGTNQRRQHLHDTKYFWCRCTRCTDPTELGTYFSALKCLGTETQPCDGTQLPPHPTKPNPQWVCNKCRINLPNDEIMPFVEHLGSEVDKILAIKPTIAQLEELLEKLSKFLHPNHYHLYTVRHTLVQMFNQENTGGIELSSSFLEEKVKICEELIGVTRKVDPGCSRLALYLGVLLHELFLGKFTILGRNFEGVGFNEEVEELGKIVDEGRKVLEWEGDEGPGRKLLEVIENDGGKLETWRRENKV